MFQAKRFKTIPTKKCRERLEKAMTNRKPISKREKNRAAVMAIQSALADLNNNYLNPAEVDGWFGSGTYDAVESFQRDYGLVADGIVSRQTLTQLDSLYSGDVMREPIGVSIHLGLDRVDANHYGSDFPLSSCVNDAEKMKEIAENIGYDTVLLANEDATVNNFTAFMRNAIDNLFNGDSLMVTFSGHGSQVENTSVDAESDNKDETLCFYDRMFIDDEIYALLGQFREGVRVHLIFDSCHSGTVAKSMEILNKEKEEYLTKTLSNLKSFNDAILVNEENNNTLMLKTISATKIDKALDGDRPDFAKEVKYKSDSEKEIAELFTDLYNDESTAKSKSIEFFNGVYNRNKQLYDTVKNIVGPKDTQHIECAVVSLSACQDNQTTPAGSILSLFTSNINLGWGSSEYQGSYNDFHKNIVDNTGRPDVTPAINTYGGNRSRIMLFERPFSI